jgi:hypothetical protein
MYWGRGNAAQPLDRRLQMAFDIIKWMSDHNHPGYAAEINEINSVKDEVKAEAGPNWQLCPFTQEWLKKLDQEIADVRAEAQDRYDDWASD